MTSNKVELNNLCGNYCIICEFLIILCYYNIAFNELI